MLPYFYLIARYQGNKARHKTLATPASPSCLRIYITNLAFGLYDKPSRVNRQELGKKKLHLPNRSGQTSLVKGLARALQSACTCTVETFGWHVLHNHVHIYDIPVGNRLLEIMNALNNDYTEYGVTRVIINEWKITRDEERYNVLTGQSISYTLNFLDIGLYGI